MLVEKPMATSLEECYAMIAACEKSGKVIQVLGLGPHRLGAAGRPEWFFQKEK